MTTFSQLVSIFIQINLVTSSTNGQLVKKFFLSVFALDIDSPLENDNEIHESRPQLKTSSDNNSTTFEHQMNDTAQAKDDRERIYHHKRSLVILAALYFVVLLVFFIIGGLVLYKTPKLKTSNLEYSFFGISEDKSDEFSSLSSGAVNESPSPVSRLTLFTRSDLKIPDSGVDQLETAVENKPKSKKRNRTVKRAHSTISSGSGSLGSVKISPSRDSGPKLVKAVKVEPGLPATKSDADLKVTSSPSLSIVKSLKTGSFPNFPRDKPEEKMKRNQT